jgi:hypothetical protein
MTEIQQRKFEKWLAPKIKDWGRADPGGPYLETDEGVIYAGTPEHDEWVDMKRKEFFRLEPPLAGMVYKRLTMEEFSEMVNRIIKEKNDKRE